uniref:Uncharacterized protein n=1 Tax=Clytia hemisphaerica TaxID=252671 RepID=A0A7M5XN96_9CNID
PNNQSSQSNKRSMEICQKCSHSVLRGHDCLHCEQDAQYQQSLKQDKEKEDKRQQEKYVNSEEYPDEPLSQASLRERRLAAIGDHSYNKRENEPPHENIES